MKIIAITDIHGAFDRVERILERETGCDAVILGGDLTTNGTVEQACEAVGRFQRRGLPLYVVAGNMDHPDTDDALMDMGVSINGRGMMLDYVGLFGVSASPFTPLHTPYEISEDEIALRAHAGWKDVQTARTSIFVPHAPPHNTRIDMLSNGNHAGSTAVRKFIEQFHPTAVVCGHIHEARGKDALGATTIVNCGPARSGNYAILTIAKEIGIELRG